MYRFLSSICIMKQFNIFILVIYALSFFYSGVSTQEILESYYERFARTLPIASSESSESSEPVQHTKCKNETDSWLDKDGCNWCSCNDGLPICTMMLCESYNYHNHNLKKLMGRGNVLSSSSNCKKEKGTWLDDDGCNFCSCIGGVKGCTHALCEYNGSPKYNMLKLAVKKSNCKQETGSWLDDDGCNRCSCIHGEPACTMMQCGDDDYSEHKQLRVAGLAGHVSKCKQETGSWLHADGCNRCICVHGVPRCTLKKCVIVPSTKCKKETGRWLDKGATGCKWCQCKDGLPSCKWTSDCGQKKGANLCKKRSGRWKTKDGCGWCFCDQKRIICTKKANKKPCKNNHKLVTVRGENICKDNIQSQFMSADGCNWCYCIDSVTPICTQMICYKPAPGKKLTHISKAEPNGCDAPDRTPGRFLHTDGCNWCYCIGSTLLMCTIIFCPQQISETELPKKKMHVLQTYSNGVPDAVDLDDPGNYLQKHVMLTANKLHNKSLKDLAKRCKKGSKFKDPLGCNWCNCIEDGVVVCDQNDCSESLHGLSKISTLLQTPGRKGLPAECIKTDIYEAGNPFSCRDNPRPKPYKHLADDEFQTELLMSPLRSRWKAGIRLK